MSSLFGNKNKEVIFNFCQKSQEEDQDMFADHEILIDEQLQCFNCNKYFDPTKYGIDLLDEMDFNKNLDTFCCENCYLSLHFPFYYQLDLLLKMSNLEVNTKYEFNLVLQEECYQDSCILGVFLSKQNLINVFKKQTGSHNFILNVKMNGQDPSQEGSNFFVIDSDDLTQMQNTLNFECLNFSFQKSFISNIILMNDQQKSQLKTASPNIISVILHCRKIRVSAYVAKLFKKKFFNCLNHESLFKVFEEQEQKYKQKDQIQKIKLQTKQNSLSTSQIHQSSTLNEIQPSQLQTHKETSNISQSSQLNKDFCEKKELTEIYLRIKNFHQMFPFMYKNEMVVKMDDNAVIQYPAFTYHHSHPFDLRDYCYLNQVNPTWLCPICNKHKIFLKEIQLDFYLFALIQTQYLKDSYISDKIQQILQSKPQFDSEFFSNQLKQLNLHSMKVLEQTQQRTQSNEIKIQQNLSNKLNQTNKNFIQIYKKSNQLGQKENILKNSTKIKQFKCKSSIDQNTNYEQRNHKNGNQNQKSKTSEFFNENLNCTDLSQDNYLDFIQDFDEFQSFLNPYQKQHSMRNSKDISVRHNMDQANLIDEMSILNIQCNEIASQKSSTRVYSKLVNKSKSKTSSSNKEEKQKQNDAFKENQIDIEQSGQIIEEKVQEKPSLNDQIDANKNIQFSQQIESFSDLSQKFISQQKEERTLEVANQFYLDTSFLRSPLEINVLFDVSYLQFNKEEQEYQSVQQIIQLIDFQEDKQMLEKLFNIDILQNHYFIFNIFNLSYVNNRQYQDLHTILNQNPSTKTFFQVLINVQEQFINLGMSSEFYTLISQFYYKVMSNKQRNNKISYDLLDSESQITSLNYSQNKNFLEKLIECFLGMSIFKQLSNEDVIENFQQMVFEYLLFKQQNIPTLINIHNIIINYFPNQCLNLIESIKKSLNSLNICI
ncbi:MIZ zinc finger protein (macronuclear) [Tetrahymena thermophila SB210]|uniref:MIZ zinc finger protein n=1 Tax=Tetrahymena thermophila (strain SB210) TaxID=312017 RepID=Q22Z38_TETTS|nr:MIZ zinc finger protein [Tetrahymena thermophila SB210]EAR90483.1 MIZ zinc finger protein [Tetrahymena thermophila SB210]|eukprot:XP_001010728.1 MIZ zinc finger protein [Tetrahymena thermophila SB210]